MNEVTIALVGIGGYGGFYLEHLLGGDGAKCSALGGRLVAGIDPYAVKSGNLELLTRQNIPIFSDLDSFYLENTADLVIIAAAIHLHEPLTLMALSHGSNVLCEKPLCATLSQSRKMATAEQSSGKFVSVGYQWSHSEAVQSLKRDIINGVLGKPVRLKTQVYWPRNTAYYQRNDWAGALKSQNGEWVLDSPMHNATAHYLHNMLYILGNEVSESAHPVSIQAECYRINPITNFDAAAIRCITDQGAEILFYTAHSVPQLIGPLFSYEFQNASVEYLNDESTDNPWHRKFIARFNDGTIKNYGDPNEDDGRKIWYAIELVHTQKLSQSKSRPMCGISAAIPQVMCVNGAYLSRIIKNFPKESTRYDIYEDDTLIWVDNLQETFERCYEVNKLPAEFGSISWASPGRVISEQQLLLEF